MFKEPPKSLRPPEELDHILVLGQEYDKRMAALVYYLREDDIKNSDTGEAAQLEQQREEEEHGMLLKVGSRLNLRKLTHNL